MAEVVYVSPCEDRVADCWMGLDAGWIALACPLPLGGRGILDWSSLASTAESDDGAGVQASLSATRSFVGVSPLPLSGTESCFYFWVAGCCEPVTERFERVAAEAFPMKPRVAFVHLFSYGYFNTDAEITGGGAERQLYLLSQRLAADFDVHFVVGDYGQPRVEQRDGIILHRAYQPTPDAGPADTVRQLVRLFTAMHDTDAELFVLRGSPRKALVTYGIARMLGAKW